MEFNAPAGTMFEVDFEHVTFPTYVKFLDKEDIDYILALPLSDRARRVIAAGTNNSTHEKAGDTILITGSGEVLLYDLPGGLGVKPVKGGDCLEIKWADDKPGQIPDAGQIIIALPLIVSARSTGLVVRFKV